MGVMQEMVLNGIRFPVAGSTAAVIHFVLFKPDLREGSIGCEEARSCGRGFSAALPRVTV